MSTQSRITIFSPLVRQMLMAMNTYTRFAQKDADLGQSGFTKEITCSNEFTDFTLGDPQFNLNDLDPAPIQTVIQSKYPKFTVGYTQIQTEPESIQALEQQVLAFDKKPTSLQRHLRTIMQEFGNFVCKNWAIKPFAGDLVITPTLPAYKDRVILTTGAAKQSALQTAPTQVKKITFEDFTKVIQAMHDQNNYGSKIYCLISPSMFNDITNLAEVNFNQRGVIYDDIYGELQSVYNVEFIIRGGFAKGATNVVYQTTDGLTYTPLPYGSLTNANSRDCALFWTAENVWCNQIENSILRFEQLNDPKTYGDLVSLQSYMVAYKNNELLQEGVVALIEANV